MAVFRGRSHTNANVTGLLIIFHKFPFGSYLVPHSPAPVLQTSVFVRRPVIKIRMLRAVSMTDAISITTFPLSGFTGATVFQPVVFISACARPQSSSTGGREAPGRKVHFSVLRADVQLAVPRRKITKKGANWSPQPARPLRFIIRSSPPLSVQSSWFPVDWGSFPVFLSRWMYKWTKQDREPRAGGERATEDRQRCGRQREIGKEERDAREEDA